MSLGAYLWGCALLVVEIGAVALVGVSIRRRWLPRYGGAPARLVEIVGALGTVYAASLVLGAVGWFHQAPLAVVLIAAGGLASWRLPPAQPAAREPPTAPVRWMAVGASFAAGATTVAWLVHVVASYQRGILDGDSTWYHGPFMGRFLQTGWTTRLLYVNSEPLVPFFPANSEVLQSAFALPWHRDLLAPAVNLGWLAVFFLAAWCIGRPWGQGPLALAAAAVIAATPVMTVTQAGTMRNDIVGVALLAAAVALLVQPDRRPGAIALGGVACGLALGVKVSLLVPAGLLLVGGGVLVALRPPAGARRRRRRGPVWCWLIPAAGFGSYWYLRNWARLGNPLPWMDLAFGPLHLRSPPLPQAAVGQSTLFNRIGDHGLLGDMVVPGLRHAIGPLWPVVVALALGGVGIGVSHGWRAWRRRRTAGGGVTARWAPPVVAGVAWLSMAGYVVTPNSAPLPPGGELARYVFLLNTRYLLPGLLLGIAVFALRERRILALDGGVLALLVVAAVAGLFPGRLRAGWEFAVTGTDALVAVGIGAAGCLLLAGAVVAARARPGAAMIAGGVAVVVLVAVAAGRPLADRYLTHRYAGRPPYPAARLWPVGDRLQGAVVGVAGDFFQYPYLGSRLSNRVSYIGVHGPHGAFRDARTCAEWRTALRRSHVGYVIVAPQIFTLTIGPPPQLAWTRSIPGAEAIATAPAGAAFRLPATVTERGCR